ncbi:hypothetical protein [Cupriavidus sp. CuC1]
MHDASPEAGRTQAWLDRRPKNSCEPQFLYRYASSAPDDTCPHRNGVHTL